MAIGYGIRERFWAKVQKSDGCWEWRGTRYKIGYGWFEGGPQFGQWPAHRAAWVLHYGHIPSGMQVLHHCDNPPCVRIDHLWLGDHNENMADKARKGRSNHGERNPKARLTWERVAEIRLRCEAGESRKSIARAMGVTANNISSIALGQTWRPRHHEAGSGATEAR